VVDTTHDIRGQQTAPIVEEIFCSCGYETYDPRAELRDDLGATPALIEAF
jgi:hypothetical protein